MPARTVKYFREHKVHQLTKEDYEGVLDSGMFYVFYPEACGIYEDDVVSQKVNDSSHDENPDGVGWPYEMGSEDVDNVHNVTSNVTQEHFDTSVGEFNTCVHTMVYRGHGHNYGVFRCIKCGLEEER